MNLRGKRRWLRRFLARNSGRGSRAPARRPKARRGGPPGQSPVGCRDSDSEGRPRPDDRWSCGAALLAKPCLGGRCAATGTTVWLCPHSLSHDVARPLPLPPTLEEIGKLCRCARPGLPTGGVVRMPTSLESASREECFAPPARMAMARWTTACVARRPAASPRMRTLAAWRAPVGKLSACYL